MTNEYYNQCRFRSAFNCEYNFIYEQNAPGEGSAPSTENTNEDGEGRVGLSSEAIETFMKSFAESAEEQKDELRDDIGEELDDLHTETQATLGFSDDALRMWNEGDIWNWDDSAGLLRIGSAWPSLGQRVNRKRPKGVVRLPRIKQIVSTYTVPDNFLVNQEQLPDLIHVQTGEYVCAADVRQSTLMSLGGRPEDAAILNKLGFIDDDAWKMSNNVEKALDKLSPYPTDFIDDHPYGFVDHTMGEEYLQLVGSTDIKLVRPSMDQYLKDLLSNRSNIESDIRAGGKVSMACMLTISGNRRRAAAYNFAQRQKDPNFNLSLNTHKVRFLAVEPKKVSNPIIAGETLTTYLVRSQLHGKTEFKKLFEGRAALINGKKHDFNGDVFVDESGQEVKLKKTDNIMYIDLYCRHNMGHGPIVTSYAETISSAGLDNPKAELIPTNTTTFKRDGLLSLGWEPPFEPIDSRLQPVEWFTPDRAPTRGGTPQGVEEAFKKYISTDFAAFQLCIAYWRTINFDTAHVPPGKVVPIPSLGRWKEYLEERGGGKLREGVVRMEEEQTRQECDAFNQDSDNKNKEYLLGIVKGDMPRNLLLPLLQKVDEDIANSLTEEEWLVFLDGVDEMNHEIDLTLVPMNNGKKKFKRWLRGGRLWISQEHLEMSVRNIRRNRILSQGHVPDKIDSYKSRWLHSPMRWLGFSAKKWPKLMGHYSSSVEVPEDVRMTIKRSVDGSYLNGDMRRRSEVAIATTAMSVIWNNEKGMQSGLKRPENPFKVRPSLGEFQVRFSKPVELNMVTMAGEELFPDDSDRAAKFDRLRAGYDLKTSVNATKRQLRRLCRKALKDNLSLNTKLALNLNYSGMVFMRGCLEESGEMSRYNSNDQDLIPLLATFYNSDNRGDVVRASLEAQLRDLSDRQGLGLSHSTTVKGSNKSNVAKKLREVVKALQANGQVQSLADADIDTAANYIAGSSADNIDAHLPSFFASKVWSELRNFDSSLSVLPPESVRNRSDVRGTFWYGKRVTDQGQVAKIAISNETINKAELAQAGLSDNAEDWKQLPIYRKRAGLI